MCYSIPNGTMLCGIVEGVLEICIELRIVNMKDQLRLKDV